MPTGLPIRSFHRKRRRRAPQSFLEETLRLIVANMSHKRHLL